jgi:hypothetical protein
MTSKQVKELLSSEKGASELYKINLRYFEKIDEVAELYTNSDLLDEYTLSHSMDVLTGCYAKLNPIAGAMEAILEEMEYGTECREYSKLETVKTTDTNVIKAKARDSVKDIRHYLADFSRYCQSAQALVVTAQSRLKRLSVESGLKGVDFKGSTSEPAVQERQKPREDIKAPIYDKVKTDIGWA